MLLAYFLYLIKTPFGFLCKLKVFQYKLSLTVKETQDISHELTAKGHPTLHITHFLSLNTQLYWKMCHIKEVK